MNAPRRIVCEPMCIFQYRTPGTPTLFGVFVLQNISPADALSP